MGVGDVALSARADGDEQRLAPATAHVADEFFFSPKVVAIAVRTPENTVEPILSSFFVARQRDAETGMARRQFRSDGKSEVAGHLLALKFAIPVFVELNYGLPERQGIGLNIRAAAELGGGDVQHILPGHRRGDGLAGEAGDEPFL